MIYTVKKGDTLSKIAKAHGLTLAALVDANPRFKADPNSFNVGARIAIPGAPAEIKAAQISARPPAAPAGETQTASVGRLLGKLSEKYETGGRGAGTVSSGKGDVGGVSYGSYQMTSRGGGTVGPFVSQPGFPWRTEFFGLTPGSAEFSKVWRMIARSKPQEFGSAQHAYIKATHFDILVSRINEDEGLDLTKRSAALQDAIWSTAVQHGPRAKVVHNAINQLRVGGLYKPQSPDFDRDLIKAIYAERGRKYAGGQLVYFSKNSPAVQRGVANRFINEERDVLRMLGSE